MVNPGYCWTCKEKLDPCMNFNRITCSPKCKKKRSSLRKKLVRDPNPHIYDKNYVKKGRKICPEGTIRQQKNGYKTIKINGTWMLYHHYVFLKENKEGIKVIHRNYCIHHKNGNLNDNHISNLRYMRQGFHSSLHKLGLVPNVAKNTHRNSEKGTIKNNKKK